MTFSIVGRCARTGELGVAVSTAVPAVGSMCPYLRAGVGAVSTQSWVNPYLAMHALDSLEQGDSADAALERVLRTDSAAALRQIGIVDAQGRSAVWTGSDCTAWAGHRRGADYTVQGNMLTGAETVEAMADAFESRAGEALDERLMAALEAGQAAGGDRRGRQSAALRIVRTETYPALDLRVDEHAQPVAELRRVLAVARHQLIPFIDAMPTRDDPGRAPPSEVTQLLLKAPAARPGGADAMHAQAAQVLARWMGASFTPDRLAHNLTLYGGILAEIERLREIDLAGLHPAVVFEPVRSQLAGTRKGDHV
ncbi:DUF1028 domain-containing protein [Paraburkholderia fungorum]|jgi:uncharacterized Ntn-hydrolase superfamily protein|uniref:DUF1028 domain-containing protein n=1 Tax=Paraburkholderia fungorum TaxID=134537 RepID=A0AAP5QJS9_9BURK|nr:DUF1028 domain-containing protein [Paraburkholderia fungorum]MDT8843572.1 DUF1028 domain-containing protein [Paraburkholderia fungorum]